MKKSGQEAERAALHFLETKGLRLVQRNYRCRFGEIDLIMRDADDLVFVEVRMRSSGAFGGASESITAAKRARLLAAARHFIATQRTMPGCRFDALLLNGDSGVEWVRNAFGE